MRVLVCGGRDFNDYELMDWVLFDVDWESNIQTIVHGDAPGADTLAGKWAQEYNIPCEVYPADWKRYGKKAGFLRNKQMLEEGKPDLVVAFPGGAGTRMMVKLAQSAGVKCQLAYVSSI